MDISERFWNASFEELKQGYIEEGSLYICLLDGHTAQRGMIYPVGDLLFDAECYIQHYIRVNFNSVFETLIQMDKKHTGLTDHQSHLLCMLYEGKSDAEIMMETGISSASTIRNFRFNMKAKERQAKLFCSIMDLLRDRIEYPNFKN